MKRLLTRIGLWVGRITVILFCGFVSVYLLLSGYESIYNRALPFVHTVEAVNLTAFNGVYNFPKTATHSSKYYGNFGMPDTIKLPLKTLSIGIVPAIQEGNSWLARANTMQMLIPDAPRDGNIGVLFLYCRSSSTTINNQTLPAQGANIFMDTNTLWQYVYQVISAKAYAYGNVYVPSDDGSTGKLLIDCDDSSQHISFIIEANLLSVEGIEQE